MSPPRWALKNSEWLELDEFMSLFSLSWRRTESRFIKLECWQTYQEITASASQEAYDRGDRAKAAELLRQEAEADRPLYADIETRDIDYARIRLVQFPLTDYLRYELIAYQIRVEMGERIEFVRFDAGRPLPNADCFDFLLFDCHTALIHDYGDVGRQSGGWVTRDPEVIASLERTVLALRAESVSWTEFNTELR